MSDQNCFSEEDAMSMPTILLQPDNYDNVVAALGQDTFRGFQLTRMNPMPALPKPAKLAIWTGRRRRGGVLKNAD